MPSIPTSYRVSLTKKHMRLVFKRTHYKVIIGQTRGVTINNITNTTESEAGEDGRLGWLRIVDVIVPGGSAGSKTYHDAPNNTILDSALLSNNSFQVLVESSYPKVVIGGVPTIIPPVGDIYRGLVNASVSTEGEFEVSSWDANDEVAASDKINIFLDVPPQITSLNFTGGYPLFNGTFGPVTQTELKAGDTFQITGTTDKPADSIRVANFGASDTVQDFAMSGTSFTITIVIGDRGTTAQSLPALLSARSPDTGAYGPGVQTNDSGSVDGVNEVVLNNIYPTVDILSIGYPGSQGALKASEIADVIYSLNNFDDFLFDSPNGEIDVPFPTDLSVPQQAQRVSGAYNITVPNLRLTANRHANGTITVDTVVVKIADVAPIITITSPSRMRSGGSDGTAVQNHNITLSSNQQLLNTPTMDNDLGGARGTFVGAWSGGPSNYTRVMQVDDNDEKGTFNYSNLVATNLAGIMTNIITSGGSYVLGGFAPRTVTFSPFSNIANLGVAITDFSKLQAGIFTATNQQSIKQAIGTGPSITNGYTIDAVGNNPTQIIWLDTPALSSNSGGTAQLLDIEEIA